MGKKSEINRLKEQNLQLTMELAYVRSENMELSASVARLKMQLSDSRMRQASLVESSRGIHIL